MDDQLWLNAYKKRWDVEIYIKITKSNTNLEILKNKNDKKIELDIKKILLVTMIYNYITSSDLDCNMVINLNNCCQTGIFLAYTYYNHFQHPSPNSDESAHLKQYINALSQLKTVLGNSKKINNKNLITSILTLNSYLDSV